MRRSEYKRIKQNIIYQYHIQLGFFRLVLYINLQTTMKMAIRLMTIIFIMASWVLTYLELSFNWPNQETFACAISEFKYFFCALRQTELCYENHSWANNIKERKRDQWTNTFYAVRWLTYFFKFKSHTFWFLIGTSLVS